jgi:hypothetical protein
MHWGVEVVRIGNGQQRGRGQLTTHTTPHHTTAVRTKWPSKGAGRASVAIAAALSPAASTSMAAGMIFSTSIRRKVVSPEATSSTEREQSLKAYTSMRGRASWGTPLGRMVSPAMWGGWDDIGSRVSESHACGVPRGEGAWGGGGRSAILFPSYRSILNAPTAVVRPGSR